MLVEPSSSGATATFPAPVYDVDLASFSRPLNGSLLLAFQHGEEVLFRLLVTRLRQRVQRYCERHASRADDIPDLVQTTFVLAWQHRALYRGLGSFEGWVLRLARTVCARSISQLRTHVCLQDVIDIAVEERDEPLDAIARREMGDHALDHLARLPSRQRAMITARYYPGFSLRETAAACRCAPGTVKATCFQGLRALRADLNECAGSAARCTALSPTSKRTTAHTPSLDPG